MFTAKVFWRRDSVLKSGTVQFRPTSRSRLSTNPPRHGHSDQWRFHGSICRSAMPNSFHREARLDSGIAVGLLAATPACRRSVPAHLGVEPDRQRTTALQRIVIGWPVPGPVGRGCRSAHVSQLPRWIHEMNPTRDLCNRAIQTARATRRRNARIQNPYRNTGVSPLGWIFDEKDFRAAPST